MIFLSDPSEEPLIPIKFVTTGTIIKSLHQVFANPGLSKVSILEISPSYPTRIEDFCRSLNILLLQSPPNLNGLDEQLVDIEKRKLLVVQGVKGILNSFQLSFLEEASCCCKDRVALSNKSSVRSIVFKPKVIQTEINLDTCDLPPPWNPETPQTSAIIGPTFTPNASEELEKDLRSYK